jgi:hypothetical protein
MGLTSGVEGVSEGLPLEVGRKGYRGINSDQIVVGRDRCGAKERQHQSVPRRDGI